MNWSVYLAHLIVMAGVTYLIRMLPLTLFRREIKSVFLRSFLYYVPYAVLGAMTIPGIFYATSLSDPAQFEWPAVAGLAVAAVMAWRGRSLLTVALGACVAVAAAQGIALFL